MWEKIEQFLVKNKSIVVRTGECQVSRGQKVKKGDILISGVSNILDNGGNVIKKNGVCADGDVIIEYDKEYFYECSRKYIDRNYTNRKNISVVLRKEKREIINIKNLPLLTKKFDNYDVIVNNYNVVVCKNLYMPINFDIKYMYEYENIKKVYTDKQLQEKAKDAYERYKNRLKNNKKEIICSYINMKVDDFGIYSKGYVTIQDRNNIYDSVKPEELLVNNSIKEY